MPLGSELQANRLLAAYLFSQVNRLSLFYVQFFFHFFFAFLCGNLSTTFHASQLDPTCSIFSRLFLCFSGLNAFDTQLGRTGRLAGFLPASPPASQPVVPSRGPPQNQLLTWHNLWPNHANFGIFFFCSVMESHDDERWGWVERRRSQPGLRHKLLALCQKANSGIYGVPGRRNMLYHMIAEVYTCYAA